MVQTLDTNQLYRFLITATYATWRPVFLLNDKEKRRYSIQRDVSLVVSDEEEIMRDDVG